MFFYFLLLYSKLTEVRHMLNYFCSRVLGKDYIFQSELSFIFYLVIKYASPAIIILKKLIEKRVTSYRERNTSERVTLWRGKRRQKR